MTPHFQNFQWAWRLCVGKLWHYFFTHLWAYLVHFCRTQKDYKRALSKKYQIDQ